MPSTPKFSIVIPTFNRPEMLARAVKSILAQDFDSYEVIIQDGGTEHATFESPNVRYYVEPDGGITDAINRGFSRATGEIYNWSNDDDEVLPGTLRFVDEAIGGLCPRHKWLYGKILYGDEPYGREWDYETLRCANIVPQPSVYWRREIHEPFDGTNDLVSDYEMWLRLGARHTPLFTPRLMAQYNVHPGQITQTRTREQLEQAEKVKLKYRSA
jgi:glycosyltransferase involved in cell wall biosynthesis